MSKITVLFFATFRDKAGTNRTEIEIPEDTTIAGLRAILVDKYPLLESLADHALASINRAYAFDEEVIPDGAEVAWFPPVSGGSDLPTIFSITEDELDLNELVEAVTLPSTGAACVFTGMVRGVTKRDDPHETEFLEYEAYAVMAESKMQQVADEIREKWPTVEGIAIVQRIGRLYPGTPTVLIACSAAHRDTGVFEASRYGIDRLKEIVPVWKKEVGTHGEEWVEGDYRPQPGE
ncbi:MAG: molybdenum cofactor biosynthesis protein MoaE [Anaerolineales bacterium]